MSIYNHENWWAVLKNESLKLSAQCGLDSLHCAHCPPIRCSPGLFFHMCDCWTVYATHLQVLFNRNNKKNYILNGSSTTNNGLAEGNSLGAKYFLKTFELKRIDLIPLSLQSSKAKNTAKTDFGFKNGKVFKVILKTCTFVDTFWWFTSHTHTRTCMHIYVLISKRD